MATSVSPIGADALRASLAAGQAIVVDVREPGEFAGGHIPGSVNVPLSKLDKHDFSAVKEGMVVLVCASGRRSAMGCEALLGRQGFGDAGIRSLEGGVSAFRAAGGGLASTGKGVIPIERQVFAIAGLLVLAGVMLGAFVHPGFLALAAFVGAGLTVSGLTGFCGMALLLAKAPWNQRAAATA